MELTLHSERLTLTPLQEADVDIVTALFTDPQVLKYGGPMEAETVQREMPTWVRRGAGGSLGVWCACLSESGEKIGTGALLPMPVDADETDWDSLDPNALPEADIEIGYYLKPSAWGQGFATEISRRLLEFAFKTAGLKEVVATFDPRNQASRRVLLKSGFLDCGNRRCYGEEGPDFRIAAKDWAEFVVGKGS